MMPINNQIISINKIQNRIYTIRGVQVMLDEDLAKLYNVPVKRLNEQVKRNINRFPDNFRFQLTKEEFENLRCQNGTLKNQPNLRSQIATLEKKHGQHKKYLPYVFNEQGISMLSAVLRSDVAIKVSIQIIDAFVEMRKFISNNAIIFSRLEQVEQKQIESDKKFNQILDALEDKSLKPKQGIFYDGQIFDAYVFVADLIKNAKKSIVLIDNFVDESVLQLFTKRKSNVNITVYTQKISKTLQQDLKKHNKQYPKIEIKTFDKAHDRFLIIDEHSVYHFGASLKDLGKKWFAFSRFDKEAIQVLDKLKNN